MGFGYNNIKQYVDKSDEARHDIVQKCHDVGYIIPTDEMRDTSGLPHITITDIPYWLIKRTQSIILAKTISTNVVYLDSSLKESIPDLEIQWEFDASHPHDNIVKIKDITESVIRHEYPTTGTHIIALFSPSMLDKVASYTFNGNRNIKEITLTPVIKTLDSYSFFNTTNLTNVYFQGDALKIIKNACFYNTAIKDFKLPDSVEEIYGGDSFETKFDHFVIDYTKSKLKKLVGKWIFDFGDKVTQDDWIDIPSGCRFYINEGTEITNETEEKIKQAEYNSNPFTRSPNRFRIHGSEYVMNDDNGIIYLKDTDGNPVCILHVPCYDIFDDYTIPSTVKYISYGSFMSIDTSRKIPIKIPSTIEHIHPSFIYWNNKKFDFSSSNNRYKRTTYGGLMTYSDSSKFGGDPDVLLYEPPITGEYSFPSNFSSIRDFENKSITTMDMINSGSNITTVKINKNFPKFTNEQSVGPFGNNPKTSFEYLESSCDNYTIYDNCLYMKGTDNDHEVLIGVPKYTTEFTIHPSCRKLYMGTFRSCKQLTGNLILDNIEETGYGCFTDTPNLDSIQIGDKIKGIQYHQVFGYSGIKTLKIGKTKDSQLTNFGGSSVLFVNMSNLTDIWITSTRVTNVSKVLFYTIDLDKTIHIYFYNDDGSETETYKAFKKAGYSATIRTETRVILQNIG